jgi:F420-dependent oxidoreductase-like protein
VVAVNELKFGVFLPFYAFRNLETGSLFNIIQNITQECEQLGYHSVLLDDHLMFNKIPILECWTTLSALSAATKKIRLGTMVTCNGFRNPALLAKMAATVDNISNGRLELAIGAGVQQNEHNSYGFPFSSTKARIERLNEAVEIIKKLWTAEKANYNGKHYTIQDAVCEPKPVQKPHPPVTIGGGGEKFTMKVTAQHANRYDWGYLQSLELYKHKLEVLGKHCDTVGRRFEDIEKSCWPSGQIFIGEDKKEVEKKALRWLPKGISIKDFLKTSFVGTPEDFVKELQPYLNLGVTHFMLFFGDLLNLEGLNVFAEKVVQKIGN